MRLTLASTLQRLPVKQRVGLGRALASHPEDASDHNLPSIVWYGLIPLIEEDPMALVEIAGASQWPSLHRWIARSLAGQAESSGAALDLLLTTDSKAGSEIQAAVVQGISEAYKGWKSAPEPPAWASFVTASKNPESAAIRELSLLFGNTEALAAVRTLVLDRSADLAKRKPALEALIENRPDDLRAICEQLLDQEGINTTAARGLANFEDAALGEEIAQRYGQFAQADRSSVLEVLVSRPAWAAAALAAMKAGKIPRNDLAAFHARQIRAFNNEKLDAELDEVWGELRDSPEEKRKLIEKWKTRLSINHISTANLAKGRVVFNNVCGACHKLYGQGGTIGRASPDLAARTWVTC